MIGSGVMPFGKRRPPGLADKLAAARLLAERGPIYGEDAIKALGWTTERWWDVVGKYKDWFGLTGRGWALSAEGTRALRLHEQGEAPI